MQLSKRLLAVSDMVTSGTRIADVGTDHAYIPIYLMEQGRINGALAMDINKGPLIRAKENIDSSGLAEKIETRLSDGAAKLRKGEADSVIIAGMGGSLTIHILESGSEVLKTVSELILQPQSDIEAVRRYLQEHAYRITRENMILEDGKFYPMMHVISGSMEALSEIEYKYGPCLLKDKNSCLLQFLEKESSVYISLKKSLQESGSEKATQRLQEIEQELALINSAKEKLDR